MTDAKTFNYQAEAQQTKSNQFHGNLVSVDMFRADLMNAIERLQDLDVVKKTLFYGKENKFYAPKLPTKSCQGLPFEFDDPTIAVDVIHSIIGKATEAGELLELLYAVCFDNKSFDPVNFKEEIADGQWYDAIGLEAVGSNFEEVQKTNINKLRARFPNRFTEYDANNRNLVEERKILEK